MVDIDNVSAKLKYIYDQAVVRKDLILHGQIGRMPRFISEYLIAKACGDHITPECLKKVSELVERYYREPQEKDRVKFDLVKNGRVDLIAEIKVEKDVDTGLNFANLLNIPIEDPIIIPDIIVENNPRLLEMGLWGKVTIEYNPTASIKMTVTDFKPFQIAEIELEEFAKGREEFTTEEWIDILISTIGYNPTILPKRKKLIILTRLLPLVEENINLMELGPRNTGKTYVFSNSSFYARIFSGGRISPAVLIWNLARDAPGEIPTRDCVVFDEIAKIRFINAAEMMGKLKHFMASGEYERGKRKGSSGCSLAFLGNVDVSGERPIEDFTYVLPEDMRDVAFIDRLHGFIPGWEIPKVGKAEVYLSRYYGFATDYFSEIMHQLRKKHEFIAHITNNVELQNVDRRDQIGIERIASGLLKLLTPHGEFTNEDLKLAMDIAIEYRQRIADWLHYMAPGEYRMKRIGYRVKG
ncbi:MAG: BREX system Lon protease-like protein BrxL [Thermoproteota archaeon]|nr:MAG: BREX system Lon protease-like protein BrxL [Candidatus Korarchaeota archaeon]